MTPAARRSGRSSSTTSGIPTELLLTLEEYLKRRGNIASAAQVLYVHPNTLRQRMSRIRDLTDLDMANEDWLLVEIELKLLRLEHALGQTPR